MEHKRYYDAGEKLISAFITGKIGHGIGCESCD